MVLNLKVPVKMELYLYSTYVYILVMRGDYNEDITYPHKMKVFQYLHIDGIVCVRRYRLDLMALRFDKSIHNRT